MQRYTKKLFTLGLSKPGQRNRIKMKEHNSVVYKKVNWIFPGNSHGKWTAFALQTYLVTHSLWGHNGSLAGANRQGFSRVYQKYNLVLF